MDTASEHPITEDEIARLAHAIWEAEGRPEGLDREHWQRARDMLAAGGAEGLGHAPRPVQPGFQNTPPGTVPRMKKRPEPGELREGPGGRFAEQLSKLPETRGGPGPRDPEPMSPANEGGYVTIPSVDDAAAGSLRAGAKPRIRRGRTRE